MQLTCVFLLAACLQVSAGVYSQRVNLELKDAPLKTVFIEINQQTGYNFLYADEILSSAKPVSINVKNATLEEALKLCFANQGLNFKVENKTIIVKEESKKSVDEILNALPPVSGVIKDIEGNPIGGANIVIKGTKRGVVSDAYGNFSLDAKVGDILIISSIGFSLKEIKITEERKDLIVILNLSSSPLDEIQIMAYGTTSRRLNTGSITTIKSEDISKQPVNNPLYALQGRVPNLIITPTDGNPGSPVKLQLRGQNSLAATDRNGNLIRTEPLIIIDGVPFTNNIDGPNGIIGSPNLSAMTFINSADIESIDVLADADATSIYGSRGGNGVILITTKKGKTGRTNINLNLTSGFNQVSKAPKMLNTEQYLEMRREAIANDGATPQVDDPNAPGYAPDLLLWDQQRNTNWQDEGFGGNAKYTTANIGISGGSSTVQYLMSGNYSSQKQFTPGENKFQTGGIHFSLTGKSSNEKFRATMTGSYSSNKSRNSGGFDWNRIVLAPNAPAPYKTNGELNWELNPNTVDGQPVPTWDNPYARLLNIYEGNVNSLNGSGDLSYNLFPSLVLRLTLGLSQVETSGFAPSTLAAMDPIAKESSSGSTRRTNSSSRSSTIDPQLNFNRQFKIGRIDILLGGSWQNQSLESQDLRAFGYTNDAFLKDLGKATSYNSSNSNSEYKYLAFFGRLNYNWQDKYIVNLSGRRDGSSRFGPDRQFGNFWSVGSAWVLTNEKFFKNIRPRFLSFAKFRGSYGSAGNDGIGDYKYLELYENNQVFFSPLPYQGITTLTTPGAVNPYYSWEDIRKSEIGAELGIFQDHILLSAAYWQTRSSNQLGVLTLPATAASNGLIVNQDAKIQNMGWDFLLTTKNIDKKNFKWSTSVNLGIQRNKLLALPHEFNSLGLSLSYYVNKNQNPIGQPFSGFTNVKEFRGVDPNTGIYLFSDVDGNAVGNTSGSQSAAYEYAKSITIRPDFSGGISNTVTFKGLTLDIFFQFTKQKGKNYLFDGNYARTGFFNQGLGNRPVAFMNRWQKPGDIVSIQRFTQQGFVEINGEFLELDPAFSNITTSDAAWVDASFIRLKNASLSYTFSNNLNQRIRVTNLRIFMQAQNLWTITKYEGPDPETQNSYALPPLRTIVAGISLGL